MTPESVLITVYRAEMVKAATRTPVTWVLYRLVLCWPRRASLVGLLAAFASTFLSFRRSVSSMLSRYPCAQQYAHDQHPEDAHQSPSANFLDGEYPKSNC